MQTEQLKKDKIWNDLKQMSIYFICFNFDNGDLKGSLVFNYCYRIVTQLILIIVYNER